MSAGLAAFLALAHAQPRPAKIPLVRHVTADLDTPVAAFWKLRRGSHSFLLESVEGGEKLARYTLLGTEPRAILSARGRELVTEIPGHAPTSTFPDHPLGALGAILDRFEGGPGRAGPSLGLDVATGLEVALPRFYGGLVGAISYDAVRQVERLPDRHQSPTDPPELVFLETRELLVWDNVAHRAMLVHLVDVSEGIALEATYRDAVASLDALQARLEGPLPPLPTSPSATPEAVTVSMDDLRYAAVVDEARELIAAGDIIQVVLSRRFTQARNGLHPFLVYRTLRGLNPSPFMFYLELGERTLVGASPELLVRRTASTREVEVRPIAGTRPRGKTPEEDERLMAELRADPKEIAEHVMLLDLGRNDLGRIAETGSVTVDAVMVFERYSHVTHLVSHVRATARPDVGPAATVAATFPAGTLSGAPKIRAMEIIDALEDHRRGTYGGAVGTVGIDGSLDLAIAIRTLAADPETFTVQAGAGIVWDSVGQTEADETRSKARAVLTAIDRARAAFAPKEVSR
ncbi:MAG: anthranilate synthase component I family protein [Deltaproteobacteria bacterium]|nr:anthranilate synthase component I family protein [Deltaproteobacteria bacterium]